MTALKPTGFLSTLVRDSRWRAGGAQPLPLAAADFGEPGSSAETAAPDVSQSPPSVQPAARVRQTIARAPLGSETNPSLPAPPVQADGADTSSTLPSAPATIVRRKPMAGANIPRVAALPTASVIAAVAEPPRVSSRVEPSAIGADSAIRGGAAEIASATAAGGPASPVHHEVRNLAVPDRPAALSEPSPSVPQRQENPVEGRRLLQTAAQPTATARLGSPAHRQSAEVTATGAAAVLPEDSSQPGPRSFEAVVAQGLTNLLGRPVVVPAADGPSGPAADLVAETTHAVYGAVAPAPVVPAAQPPVPTAARLLPSASELALSGAARPIPSTETGPRVHIGTVEIVVAAPAEKRSPVAAGAKPSSNLASRRYLRSL